MRRGNSPITGFNLGECISCWEAIFLFFIIFPSTLLVLVNDYGLCWCVCVLVCWFELVLIKGVPLGDIYGKRKKERNHLLLAESWL